MFKLVLLGIAGETMTSARPVLGMGAELAARYGAGFAVLHVSAPLSRDGGCVLQLPGEAELAGRREAVEDLCREVMPSGLTADVLLETGFLHVEMLKTARLLSPDLVVIGGLDEVERCRRELAGNGQNSAILVAEGADCPVLVVPAEANAATGDFRRIMAATDLGFSATPLVNLAACMAGSGSAELRAFHALPQAGFMSAETELSGLLERAGERLGRLCRDQRRPMTWGVREGDVAVEILKDAREFGADLLVLASDAYAASGTFVAARVLAGARCPVLLVGPGAQTAGRRQYAVAAQGGRP